VSAGPSLSRRAAVALGSAGVLAVAAGCDSSGGPDRSASPPDPDAALVEGVTRRIGAAEQLARAAGMSRLADLHRQHLLALHAASTSPTTSPSTSPSTSPTPGGRAGRAAVLRTERQLAAALADAAVRARSGQLARVLASMAAAVDQRVAVLGRGAS
jgi:hypothetical protein